MTQRRAARFSRYGVTCRTANGDDVYLVLEQPGLTVKRVRRLLRSAELIQQVTRIVALPRTALVEAGGGS